MKRIQKIAIISSYIRGDEKEIDHFLRSKIKDYDLIMAADGGLDHAIRCKIECDLILGDFDSISKIPTKEDFPNSEIIRLPIKKDFTDLQFALDKAIEYRPERITILGGIGGQTDHTISNIQSMVGAYEECHQIKMVDPYETIHIQGPGQVSYPAPAEGSRFSVLAIGGPAQGVTLKGGAYEVENLELLSYFPLGVSNVSLGKDLYVKLDSGFVAVITH